VAPIHITLYGFPPPKISEKIMVNLEKIAEWYIEEKFSYIRVFRCSVPPMLSQNFNQIGWYDKRLQL